MFPTVVALLSSLFVLFRMAEVASLGTQQQSALLLFGPRSSLGRARTRRFGRLHANTARAP